MQIISAKHAHSVLKKHYSSEQEEVWCLSLNPRLGLIGKSLLFRGTVDRCQLHPRDVFRQALKDNASKLLLAHNHPSGVLDPSHDDVAITRRLVKIGQMLEIPLIDHIIFNRENYLSLAEQGIIYLTLSEDLLKSEG